MFKHLSSLETLYLRNNRLETIPGDTFDSLTHLKSLTLSYNSLKTVSHTMFSHLSRLKILSLENNKLNTIPDDTFLGLGRLTRLRLVNCGLSTLRATLVSSMSHLMYLFLNDNPLVCDCQLAWVQKYNKLVQGTCANPPTASGQLVRSYNVSECNPDDTTNAGIILLFASLHKYYS